jgi:diguanylate cyclase (GGDEF)-like protein/PAS domain S-box-containing protein
MSVVYGDLINNIPAIFYRCKCDDDWTMYFISDAIEAVIGYPASDFISNKVRTFSSTLHPEDRQKVSATINKAVEQKQHWEIEYRIITKEGKETWVAEKGAPVYSDSGDLKFLDGFINNITERKQAEIESIDAQQELYKLAYIDSVSGLANRSLFNERLDKMVSYSRRYNTEFALMFIDLDSFKDVNDTYGHQVGDELIKEVGKRFSSLFREADTVARFGGDEFLVLASNVKSEEDLEILASKVLASIVIPVTVDGHHISISGSVGIVLGLRDGESASELLRNADMAMYRAKSLGKNQFCVFSHR